MSIFAYVLADFEAETAEEISLPAGSRVAVLEQGDDGWWVVDYQGSRGIFPGSYLQLEDEPEQLESEPATGIYEHVYVSDSESEPELQFEPEPEPEPEPELPQSRPLPTRQAPTQSNQGRPLPTPGQPNNNRGAIRGVPSRGASTTPNRGRPLPNPTSAPVHTSPVQTPINRGGPGPVRGAPGPNRGSPGAGPPRGGPPGPNRGGPPGPNRGAPPQRKVVNPNPGQNHNQNRALPTPKAPEPVGVKSEAPEPVEAPPAPQEPEEQLTPEQKEKKDEEMRAHRLKVVQELIQTEKDYCKDLQIIVSVFVQPLQVREIVPREDLAILFSNIDVILCVNKQLESQLLKNGEDEAALTSLMVGSIFVEMADVFKMYTAYCSNQPQSLAALDQLSTNPAFESFLQECLQNEECRGLTLFSFLIKPIQRICKYPLLLRDLLKDTPKTHPDYNTLILAMEKIEKVVEYVNERKRLAENLQKIMDVQNQIESTEELNLVEPTRRFVREGTLTVIENGRTRERKTFVFNDLIVVTKPKKNIMGNEKKDHFKAQFKLNDIQIIDHADTNEMKNACEVRPKTSGAKKTSCVFVFESPAEKAAWVKEIKTLVREFQKKEAQARKEALEKGESFGELEVPGSPAPEEKRSNSKILRKERTAPAISPSPPKNSPQPGGKTPPPGGKTPPPGGMAMYQRPPPPGHVPRNLTGRPTTTPPQQKSVLKKLLSSNSASNKTVIHSKELSKKLAKSAAIEKKHLNSNS